MITRVLDENGNVLHDCAEAGCTVSWDGVAIRDLEPEEVYPDAKKRPPNASKVAEGDKVPNAQDPDLTKWDVHGKEARFKRRDR